MLMEDFNKIDDKDLEIVTGGMTVDYTLNHYCPYHLCEHAGMQLMEESAIINDMYFPIYYCPSAGQYTFEAKNGFYDMNGNILVRKN